MTQTKLDEPAGSEIVFHKTNSLMCKPVRMENALISEVSKL